jgi:hypothetical protein
MRCYVAGLCLVVLGCLPVAAIAQQAPPQPKPGPEHELLKSLEGTWDAQITMPGETKAVPGVMTYKMDLGGLWLCSDFRSSSKDFPFEGRGLESYDAAKKKYPGVWVDSMVTSPMITEGTYDAATKTMTATGEAPMHGQLTKFRNVTKHVDNDHHTFQMFTADKDGKETLTFTIEYTRKK